MTSNEILEKELKTKAAKEAENATDPVEKLRLKLLSRGSNSIKGMGRSLASIASFNIQLGMPVLVSQV